MCEIQTKSLEESDLYKLRHSAAHVMAQAVMEMFPGQTRLAIGPPIADGFYYDFELPRALTPTDLAQIETRMKEIVREKHQFERKVLSVSEARQLFHDQPYKLELIDELEQGRAMVSGDLTDEDGVISIYTQATFTDLCRGPHVEHTGQIDPDGIKLLNVAGAYWRGDEKRPMVQRIYATAWHNRQELESYLAKREALEARDHRRINKQLDLFSVPEEIGGGLIIYGPKAGRIRAIVEEFWRQEHFASGYDLLYTPHIGAAQLWETSGHLDFYREGMYAPIDIDGQQYYLKPMNCPFHMLAYKAQTRSYRDLPLRFAELGTVYRYERSGTLHGLLRARGFTQDDAHILCTPEQMDAEIAEVLRFSMGIWRAFGFSEFNIYLSTRPPKAIGTEEQWQRATNVLRSVLQTAEFAFTVDEGGGAFYGPKIDIKVKDALGREWQNTTIQFDFNLPERFDLVYTGKDGMEHRPYMVHRALLGSWERFFGLLIEHYAGAFPVWLCPVQLQIIPVAERHNEYAHTVMQQLATAGLRVAVDDSNERMQAKIRHAQLQKIPYMVIVGQREVENNTVSVRLRSEEDLGALEINNLIARVKRVIDDKAGL